MSWIAIMTEPGKTRIVRKRLRRAGLNAYVPSIIMRDLVIRASAAKRRRRIVPLMPYVLVEDPDHSPVRHLMLHHVLTTRGVTGYVGTDGLGPSIIPDRDVSELRTRVADMVLELAAKRHRAVLSKGDRVRVKAGSLMGRAGTVTWVNAKRVELEAMLFGSVRRVTVKREDVEAA